ncbi:MAG: hypothetical protein IJI36_00945 [Kiritimatiellae bacterium]|nr:hypothetical protein [Kiritimatiellia bacterium]
MVKSAFAGKLGVAFVAVALGVCADTATGRIRHMADTYLQSDCSQIIDLGLLATTNMRFEVVFEPIETNGTHYLFGSAAGQAGGSKMKYGPYVQKGGISFASGLGGDMGGWGTGWHGPNYKATRSRFKVVYDMPKRTAELWSGETCVWNNSTLVDCGIETNDCSVVLFGNHNSRTTHTDLFGGKVYSFKLYDKGALVRDLIPYGRGAVTGMLDRCSGKVYTNVRSGGHPFVLGTDDGYVRSDRTKRSGQWLDTGYCANPQTKIEVDFALMDVTTTQQRFFGADTVDGHGLSFYVNGGKQFAWYCRDNPVPGWTGDATGVAADGERHKVMIDVPNRTVTLTSATGETLYAGAISYDCELASTTSLRLFGGVSTNATGVAGLGNAASVKIFGARIWNGDTLVRDYEPRVVDNVECLYDTVNGTVNGPDFSGSSATGKFRLTAGGDILCASPSGVGAAASADAYLDGTGSQGIETDYYTSRKSRLEIDFAVSSFGGTEYFFGAVATTRGNTNNVGLYYQLNNGNRNINFRHWNSANNNTTWPNINGAMTPSRYKIVMDLLNAKGYLYRDGAQVRSMDLFLPRGDFKNTVPLRILSTQSDNQNCGYGRLYSFAVYEDNALVHRYVPCVENGIAGVRDSIGKQFFGNYKKADGSGFTICGAGVDGGGMVFTEQPQGGRLSRGHTLALTAFAPGAAGCQWLKNGVIVEGATGRTLEVAYGEGGTTDTYQCVSYYELFGYGTSAEARVENLPSGTVMTVR